MSRTIEISDETFEKIKDQLTVDEGIDVSELEDFVGKKWFIRTVTYHLVGKITKLVGKFAVMEGASWVADSGRFMQAIKKGVLDEVEPVGDCIVNLDSVIDMFPWKHKLPEEQL